MSRHSAGTLLFPMLLFWANPLAAQTSLRPWHENPRYWELNGHPIVLLGASDDDNLFQHPQLADQLNRLRQAGGNYIRNTMSDRPDQGWEVYPFKRLENGKYDLAEWNDEYWKRFGRMLQWTAERQIVVQIEVWDRFDYTDVRQPNWKRHPYNPRNNVNYTPQQSGLRANYPDHPGRNRQPFFYTVPKLNNQTTLLSIQTAQVDKMLSYTLKHEHILYCMDNETSGDPEWGRYWAEHIRRRAQEAGVVVHMTEMWDSWDLRAPQHRHTWDHPELYAFVDVSQNNHNRGDRHWDNLMFVRGALSARPRPINAVKIYGADGGRFGDSRDGLERFWRLILGGAASARFHRPDSGLGLSPQAETHLRSMRMLLERLDLFQCEPDAAHRRLSSREEGEAFLTCRPGEQYAVYFPRGGQVTVDLADSPARMQLHWLDISQSTWLEPQAIRGSASVEFTAPSEGHWVVLAHEPRP
jgi:hypothetical protein